MNICFLFSDTPEFILNAISFYSSTDDCDFNLQDTDVNQGLLTCTISIDGCDVQGIFRALVDTPYTNAASLEIYDPQIPLAERAPIERSRANPIINAFYKFVRWLRQQNKLIEPTNFLHETDQLRIDAILRYNEPPNALNTTCEFFIPEDAANFITWWEADKNLHPGYSVDGRIKDRFLPSMWIEKLELNYYRLALLGQRVDMLRSMIDHINNESSGDVPYYWNFALGEMLCLRGGIRLRLWSFIPDSYGRFFFLELYERAKERWPETRIEKGDWLDRQMYKIEENGDIVVRWVDETPPTLAPEYDDEGVITMETLKQYYPTESQRVLNELRLTQKMWDVQRLTHSQVDRLANENKMSLSTFKRRKATLRASRLLKRNPN